MDTGSASASASASGATEKASHHDTHALPPQFILDVYRHYNAIKRADLDVDQNVIDFGRGGSLLPLGDSHKRLMKPVGTITAAAIQESCERYHQTVQLPLSEQGAQLPRPLIQDVTIYEHVDIPGLQVAPGLLPPQAQVDFVSHILHTCLANSEHRTNLQPEYDLEYPDRLSTPHNAYQQRSLFTYAPLETHAQPKIHDGGALNMSQYLSKKLRWLTIGAQYDWPTRTYSGQDPTVFPPNLADLVAGLFPHIKSESGVCLLYGGRQYMPVHRDVSEQCERALASFSFGCDGIFLIARGEDETDDPEERAKRIAVIRVRSGDCVHLTGEARWAWHAMARTISHTCPTHLSQWPMETHTTREDGVSFEKWKGFMSSKRLNVSCRQVWD